MNKSHQVVSGDPTHNSIEDPFYTSSDQLKINGGPKISYFPKDTQPQGYRMYSTGATNATPPTPPKHPPQGPPPPPPPKPPRSANIQNQETVLPQYPYSMPEENLYMNGGPAGYINIPSDGAGVTVAFHNRHEVVNSSPYHHQTGSRPSRHSVVVASPGNEKVNGNRSSQMRGITSTDEFGDPSNVSQRRKPLHSVPGDPAENGCRRRTSQGEVPLKVLTTNNSAPTTYSYGAYRASQYQPQENNKLVNYHPLYHSPVINSRHPDRYNNYYYGTRATACLADMSQGSCDNTPATPDSLDSLVCSDELCQSPPSITNDLPPPPTPSVIKNLEADWRSSNGNLSTSQLSQRDNLIEEITTPVPTEDLVSPAAAMPATDKGAKVSPETKLASPSSLSQSSSSSTSSTGSSSTPSSSSASFHSSVKGAAFQANQGDASTLSSPSNVTSTLVAPSSSTTPIVRTNSSNSAQSLNSLTAPAEPQWKVGEAENQTGQRFYPSNNNDPWAMGQKLYQQQLQQLQPQQLIQHQMQQQQLLQQQQQQMRQKQMQLQLKQQQLQQLHQQKVQAQQLQQQQYQQLQQQQLQQQQLHQQHLHQRIIQPEQLIQQQPLLNQRQLQQEQLQQIHQQQLQQQQQRQFQQDQLQQQQIVNQRQLQQEQQLVSQRQLQQEQLHQQQLLASQRQLQQEQLHQRKLQQEQLHQQQLQQQQLLQNVPQKQQSRQWAKSEADCAIYQQLVPIHNNTANNVNPTYDRGQSQQTPKLKPRKMSDIPKDPNGENFTSSTIFQPHEPTSFSNYATMQRRSSSREKIGPLVRSNSGSQVLRTSHPQLRQMTQEEIYNQQQQQMIVNRYATVGRNTHHQNHTNYYGIPQYYPPNQTDYQQTIQAQVLHHDETKGDSQRHRKQQHKTGSNDSLAARINRDLTSNQIVTMRLTEAKPPSNDLKDSLPLTDVWGMAKNAQPRPLPTTPTLQQNRHTFNSRPVSTRLPESRSCDEILSADTDDEPDESGVTSGGDAGESDENTSAKEDRLKYPQRNSVKSRKKKLVKRTSVPELLSPPKPPKPPFTIEGAMSNIFKRKKNSPREEIDDVVIEKVITKEVIENPPENPEPSVELKPIRKGLKGRFFFSLSKPPKKEDTPDTSEQKNSKQDASKGSTAPSNKIQETNEGSQCVKDCQINHKHSNSNAAPDTAAATQTKVSDQSASKSNQPAQTRRWSRHSKGSPPPPPLSKSSSASSKPPAPPPPPQASDIQTFLPTSPDETKMIHPIMQSSSTTSLQSSGQHMNGGPRPNGRTSQPVTPATQKRSEDQNSLVTKLLQADSESDPKLLLRSGLEAGADDLNLSDLRKDDEAGIKEPDDKSKRKNPQVSSISGNGSSNSPLISKEPTPRSGESDENETECEEEGAGGEGNGEAMTPENEMEYCDPCYCYGKCCLDVVASIFCVSLL